MPAHVRRRLVALKLAQDAGSPTPRPVICGAPAHHQVSPDQRARLGMKEERLIQEGHPSERHRGQLRDQRRQALVVDRHVQGNALVPQRGRCGADDLRIGVARLHGGGMDVVVPIGHHHPAHLAQAVELSAKLWSGLARAVYPEPAVGEPDDGHSRAQANSAEPKLALAYPDATRSEFLETSHVRVMPFLEVRVATRRADFVVEWGDLHGNAIPTPRSGARRSVLGNVQGEAATVAATASSRGGGSRTRTAEPPAPRVLVGWG
jgi:hypothetical protein